MEGVSYDDLEPVRFILDAPDTTEMEVDTDFRLRQTYWSDGMAP